MLEGAATLIRREDHMPPAYWIDAVDLTIDLDPLKTRVLNKMQVRRNPDVEAQPLRLDGEELNLARVMVNGQGTSFKMDQGQLVLENLPEGHDAFELEIFTTCSPQKNTQLSGLYLSQDAFFTQCEAQGFRRITYFLDRPDVMVGIWPSGWTRTKNPAICSPWWRANWFAANNASRPDLAVNMCCRCMFERAIWTKPTTPCSP